MNKTLNQLKEHCDNEYFCKRLVDRASQRKSAHDQAYFIGAVELLQVRVDINFNLLMSGRLLPEELPRIKRIARIHGLQIPDFMSDMHRYQEKLTKIAKSNFIE